MPTVQTPGTKPLNVLMDVDDYAEVERIAKERRSTVSQVAREFIVTGADRYRRLQEVVAVA